MANLQAGPISTCSLLLALFVVSCSDPSGQPRTGGTGGVATEEPQGEYFVFDRLSLGQSGAFREPTERVYREESAWRVAQDSLRLNLPPAAVDFTQSMVVLMALPQESGGYSIEVQSVQVRSDTLIVEYELAVPASDCIVTTGRSLPFQAVSVRRSDLPVRFVRDEAPRKCTWRQDR